MTDVPEETDGVVTLFVSDEEFEGWLTPAETEEATPNL